MKKFTFFIVVTLCVSSISFSQINKGSVLLGGNISFGFGTTENVTNTIPNTSTNYKNHGFLVSPSVGIAIKENTILGIGLSYGNSQNGNEQSPQSQNTSSVGGNIYVRKYLLLGKNFYLFGQANTYYNYTKQDNKTANGDMNNYKVSRIGFNFYPGLSYAVNRKLHLDAGINNLLDLGYSINKYENVYSGNQSTITSKGFSFDANANVAAPFTIGIRFLFAK